MFRLFQGQDMVSKQTLQVQEDHEARLERTGRRSPQFDFVHLALLAGTASNVGRVHGEQRGTHARKRLHEQFRTLVPHPSSGLNAETSDDVTDHLSYETT